MQGLYYVFFVTFVPYQQQHETTQRIFVLASLYTVSPPPPTPKLTHSEVKHVTDANGSM